MPLVQLDDIKENTLNSMFSHNFMLNSADIDNLRLVPCFEIFMDYVSEPLVDSYM